MVGFSMAGSRITAPGVRTPSSGSCLRPSCARRRRYDESPDLPPGIAPDSSNGRRRFGRFACCQLLLRLCRTEGFRYGDTYGVVLMIPCYFLHNPAAAIVLKHDENRGLGRGTGSGQRRPAT